MASAQALLTESGESFQAGVICRLRPGESDRLYRHLLRLEKHDRWMRFCGAVSDASIHLHCFRRRPLESITLGFFVGSELRGAGELIFDTAPRWLRICEVALSVEGPFQDRGVGTELLRRIVTVASNRWMLRMRMYWLTENVKVQAIAVKFDPELAFEPGQVECRIRPPWATYRSVIEEMLASRIQEIGLPSVLLTGGGHRIRAPCSFFSQQG